MENFELHLNYYLKRFHVLSPDEFEVICKDSKLPPLSKPLLVLTFDDGMENNKYVIDLLDKKNIKAYFFVIPSFINSEEPENYLSTFIRPGYINKNETEPEDFRPMGWEMLKKAEFNGHKIGSHTYSHTLVKEDNEEKSAFEIIQSKKAIEGNLSIGVPYFCSINNTSLSVGKSQEDLIHQNYSYHFTTYYGNNFPLPQVYSLERVNIEAYWHMNEVYFALGNIRKLLIKK